MLGLALNRPLPRSSNDPCSSSRSARAPRRVFRLLVRVCRAGAPLVQRPVFIAVSRLWSEFAEPEPPSSPSESADWDFLGLSLMNDASSEFAPSSDPSSSLADPESSAASSKYLHGGTVAPKSPCLTFFKNESSARDLFLHFFYFQIKLVLKEVIPQCTSRRAF